MTIDRPSGAQDGAPRRELTRLTHRPSVGVTNTPGRAPPDVNAIRSPLGAHAGRSASRSVTTTLSAARPLSPVSARTRNRRPVSVTATYATRAPSGDTDG